jgi:hypothetical protein
VRAWTEHGFDAPCLHWPWAKLGRAIGVLPHYGQIFIMVDIAAAKKSPLHGDDLGRTGGLDQSVEAAIAHLNAHELIQVGDEHPLRVAHQIEPFGMFERPVLRFGDAHLQIGVVFQVSLRSNTRRILGLVVMSVTAPNCASFSACSLAVVSRRSKIAEPPGLSALSSIGKYVSTGQ